MQIIGRILSKFLIGTSHQNLCKITVLTDIGWRYNCICSGKIVQDLEVGMWITGTGRYERFKFDDEWKMIEIDIIEEPPKNSKIHSYLNLARYFLSYEQSTQTLFQSKNIGQTHDLCEPQFSSSHNLDNNFLLLEKYIDLAFLTGLKPFQQFFMIIKQWSTQIFQFILNSQFKSSNQSFSS